MVDFVCGASALWQDQEDLSFLSAGGKGTKWMEESREAAQAYPIFAMSKGHIRILMFGASLIGI